MAASQRQIADEKRLSAGLVLRRLTRKPHWQTECQMWPIPMRNAIKTAVATDVATKADLQELKADMYKAMVSQTVILLGFVFTMLKFM